MSQKSFAGVITGNKTNSTDRMFTYAVPTEMQALANIGDRVVVPFGMGNKRMEGYIIEFYAHSDYPKMKMKSIIERIDDRPVLTEEQVELSKLIAEHIPCRRLDAIRIMIPSMITKNIEKKNFFYKYIEPISESEKIKKSIEAKKLKGKSSEILNLLISRNAFVSKDELKNLFGICNSNIELLLKKELIFSTSENKYKFVTSMNENRKSFDLTDIQKEALKKIEQSFLNNREVLLHGVTGSGKTEIYFELISSAIDKGNECIFLVPEIALTAQMIGRVRAKFGEKVAIFHSGLTSSERIDQWRMVRDKEVKIAVGPRSAVFLPFSSLGLIIVDEEHESAYKSEMNPRYDARDVAVFRSKLTGANVVFGSATPSIENYHKAKKGLIDLVELSERIGGKTLAVPTIIDMREELKSGNRSPFSKQLLEELERVINRGEQAILFLNRRGYSTFVSCRDCGEALKCKHCSVSLTYHDKGKLICHYCGFQIAQPECCPSCKSTRIRYFGSGTQKVEDEFNKIFGNGKLIRMDADTTSVRGAHSQIIKEFSDGKYSVMLGTQMVAKGLDFPNVTLVAVLSADQMLNMPDFRAGEKSFQLLTQVSGRSGRGEKDGKVFIQTYSPEHYALILGAKQDYKAFYEEEISLRKIMDLPPFKSITIIRFTGENLEESKKIALETSIKLKRIFEENDLITSILGPTTSTIEKVKDSYRFQLIIKYDNDIKDRVEEMLFQFNEAEEVQNEKRAVLVNIESNPINML